MHDPISTPPGLRVAVYAPDPGTALVSVRGELDLATAPVLDAHLAAVRDPCVVVDLSAVDFLGVAGITVLLQHRERATAFRLVARTRVVLRPLELLGLDAVFEIHANAASALSLG
ncbi:STAS domain-containing protein [Actinokineospora soli]